MLGLFAQLVEKAQKRGIAYTSLDAMKLFAIFNMTVDHIGAYIYPHDLWYRAIGRITFPVWFFLVGYTRSRTLGTTIWIYAVILLLDRPFNGLSIFAFNALFSVIACRYWLNLCERNNWLPDKIPEIIAFCIALSLPSQALFEYGSIALLFATFGRMAYLKQQRHYKALIISCYVLFVFYQYVGFKFNIYQQLYVGLGTAWVVWWLATFKNTVIWVDWTRSRIKMLLTVLSRNTLEYYFIHRLILEIIHGGLQVHPYLFRIKWFS